MTTGTTSQAGLIALGDGDAVALDSQAGLIVLGSIIPLNFASQAGLIVLGSASPCTTRRCKLWIIERRDGVILRFTSHDRDVSWGGQVYSACGSLNDSASEQSSDAGEIGNIELVGLLSSDEITAEDMYAGLYDDAYIEVWRKSWDDPTDKITREAAGWAGAVSQGDVGFQAEVLGPGARLLQKPLLESVTPGCRWNFGDAATCTVNAEALAITGDVTADSPSRAYFYSNVTDPGGSAQWDRGKVRWTYGRNAGLECEVRSVDFVTGLIVLWINSGFTPQAGDSFTLLPGCDLSFDGGCTDYNNKINFGGFPDLPGTDAISKTPDAKA